MNAWGRFFEGRAWVIRLGATGLPSPSGNDKAITSFAANTTNGHTEAGKYLRQPLAVDY